MKIKKTALYALGITTTILLLKFCFLYFDLKSNKKSYDTFVVPKIQIHKGEMLTIENTKIVFLDLGAAREQYIKNSEFSLFEGLYLREDLDINCPILKKNIQNNHLAEDNIPEGKRLFVLDVQVGPILSVLKINDVIDVIAHIDIPNFGSVTETILEATTIVAIGNKSDSSHFSNDDNQFLSFYLTPEEVKIISFMKSYSNFSVVLRNPNDKIVTKENAVTFNRFLENEKIQKIIEADSFRIINGHKFKRSHERL